MKATSMSIIPTKYLKCQQNIERIKVLECENAKILLARSHNIYIDFLNVGFFVGILSLIAPFHK